jgi:hypothetical protein
VLKLVPIEYGGIRPALRRRLRLSDWAYRRLERQPIKRRKPRKLRAYVFATGTALPADLQYDVIIDMRRLREFYTDN